jgi:Tol biopolymer transport system component
MIGKTLGHYSVIKQLGRGGMGEVFLADDLTLGRKVALKFLPDLFTGDPDRMARFEREAKLLAALNHPNIGAIYGLEQAEGKRFLVLEWVEGETVADQIRRGPIPVEESLKLAFQIAEALEAAHEKGVIHRDLKPANIMVKPDGKVKVLDFGLAKALEGEAADPDGSDSQTATMSATQAGVILGTTAYMSPEQARGKQLDKRTDIWSFGCVLYEMLTGRATFAGNTISDIIATVLGSEPDWLALPDATPAGIQRLLRRCLEKDPTRRLHDIADARIELDDALVSPPSGVGPAGAESRSGTHRAFFWIVATFALAITVIVLAMLTLRRQPVDLRPLRLSIIPPAGTTFTARDMSAAPQFALSPDGSRLAFVASARGEAPRLWVQQLESGAAQPLQGTENATGPFWAPDGLSLAFFASGKLKKVSLGGALPQELADVSVDVASGAWNTEGTIIFPGVNADGLFRISAEGGPLAMATELDTARGETSHRWPQFLPDGRRFIFYVRSTTPANSGVYLGSLDSNRKTLVLRSATNGVYAEPGRLLFEQAGNLMVQEFDAGIGSLRGQAAALGDKVAFLPAPAYLPLTIGRDGTMAYWNGQAPSTELLWFDRTGRPLGRLGAAERYQSPAISPDARKLLVTEIVSPSRTEIWNIEVSSGIATRLTFSQGAARFAIWSPDGRDVAFTALEAGTFRLYQKPASGAGQQTVLFEPGKYFSSFPEDWSRDGRWLFYNVTAKTGWDIWALNIADDRKARPIIETPANQVQARLSPDGRWLAYASDEAGAWEVYVQPFLEGKGKWLVSADGGAQPLWRGDGKELFYIAADGRLIAVPVGGDRTFEAGTRQPLFQTRAPSMLAPFRTNYAVSPDGQLFLINSISPQAAKDAITIAVNWQAGLKKR